MGGMNTIAKAVTSIADSIGAFGGSLVKARFEVFDKPELGADGKVNEAGIVKGGKGIQFYLNPSMIKVTKTATLKEDATNNATRGTRSAETQPICLELGELWFDTYDERQSVREVYINDLERLLDYVKGTHLLPVVVFNWGQFHGTGLIPANYKFFVTKLAVDYTMFLPDATPVRAKVSLTLTQATLQIDMAMQAPKESPDHAKLYTVRRGDTLQAIAAAEYEDPAEWRRIANTNNIEDPLDLRPGMKLLVPPILK